LHAWSLEVSGGVARVLGIRAYIWVTVEAKGMDYANTLAGFNAAVKVLGQKYELPPDSELEPPPAEPEPLPVERQSPPTAKEPVERGNAFVAWANEHQGVIAIVAIVVAVLIAVVL